MPMSAEPVGGGATPGLQYARACRITDLDTANPLAVEVDGEPLAIVKTDGEIFAIRDECSHAEVPLSEGEIDGCTLECWLHGSRFDLRTGQPTGPPASEPVPVYPVRIDGEDILVAVTAP
jgi:3-phenylpropionate/trans-cinnamate dioxygenase ferredoxin subunit